MYILKTDFNLCAEKNGTTHIRVAFGIFGNSDPRLFPFPQRVFFFASLYLVLLHAIVKQLLIHLHEQLQCIVY